MNELWLGLAIGFTLSSFSWIVVEPLAKVEWLASYFYGNEQALYIWTQRALAAVFVILWWI